MLLTVPPAPSSLLAVATTAHLGLASLRNHRRPGGWPVSSLALVSALLAALPWMYPSLLGLAVGLGGHVIWFAVCEILVPKGAARGSVRVKRKHPTPTATASAPAGIIAREANRPAGFVDAPVLAILEEAPGIHTFRVARPAGFDFEAGQFLTVRVRVDGRDYARCYSISSSPSARGYLDVTVKNQGLVSAALHSTMRPGALVSIKAPAGRFTYPAGDDRPLVLLAGGIGITPLFSMIRHAIDTEPARELTLIYSARRESGLAFRGELTALSRRHPQLRVVFAVTRGPQSAGVFPGHITDTLIQTVAPNVASSVTLVCGPQPMIDAMRTALETLHVPASQVRAEVFDAATAAWDGPQPARNAGGDGTAHQVHCTHSQTALCVAPGQTLLEAAEAAGVDIDSMCRAGVCGTCVTRVVDGDVDCASSTLHPADRESGYVLACVSRPRSNCTVEI